MTKPEDFWRAFDPLFNSGSFEAARALAQQHHEACATAESQARAQVGLAEIAIQTCDYSEAMALLSGITHPLDSITDLRRRGALTFTLFGALRFDTIHTELRAFEEAYQRHDRAIELSLPLSLAAECAFQVRHELDFLPLLRKQLELERSVGTPLATARVGHIIALELLARHQEADAAILIEDCLSLTGSLEPHEFARASLLNTKAGRIGILNCKEKYAVAQRLADFNDIITIYSRIYGAEHIRMQAVRSNVCQFTFVGGDTNESTTQLKALLYSFSSNSRDIDYFFFAHTSRLLDLCFLHNELDLAAALLERVQALDNPSLRDEQRAQFAVLASQYYLNRLEVKTALPYTKYAISVDGVHTARALQWALDASGALLVDDQVTASDVEELFSRCIELRMIPPNFEIHAIYLICSYLRASRFQDAERVKQTTTSYLKSQRPDSPWVEAFAAMTRGALLAARNDHGNALECFVEASDIFDRFGAQSLDLIQQLALLMADSAKLLGRRDAVIRAWTSAYNAGTSVGDQGSTNSFAMLLGDAAVREHKYDVAATFLNSIRTDSISGEFYVAFCLCDYRVKLREGRYDDAEQRLQSAAEKTIAEPILAAGALKQLATFHLYRNRADEAESCAKRLKESFANLDPEAFSQYADQIIRAAQNIRHGLAHYDLSDLSKGLEEGLKAPNLKTRIWARVSKSALGKQLASTWTAFAVTGLLFVLSMLTHGRITYALLIAAVILLHELGHVAAMRAFGCANTRILFIPFFGALARGLPTRPLTDTESFIISASGPVPGILAALLLQLMFFGSPMPTWVSTATWAFLIINWANLLPIAPLDGANMLKHAGFFRKPLSGLILETASLTAFAAMAYWILPVLWILVYLLGVNWLHTVRDLRLTRKLTRELRRSSLWSKEDRRIGNLFEFSQTAVPELQRDSKQQRRVLSAVFDTWSTASQTLMSRAAMTSLYGAAVVVPIVIHVFTWLHQPSSPREAFLRGYEGANIKQMKQALSELSHSDGRDPEQTQFLAFARALVALNEDDEQALDSALKELEALNALLPDFGDKGGGYDGSALTKAMWGVTIGDLKRVQANRLPDAGAALQRISELEKAEEPPS